MYFGGCNVAEGDAGWQFLEAAGRVFLRSAGGVVFGHDSAGLAVRLRAPIPGLFGAVGEVLGVFGFHSALGGGLRSLYKGQTFHPWGATRYVTVAPGGTIIKREES